MNTQPETYPRKYWCVRARSFPVTAGLVLVLLVLAPNLCGQESGSQIDGVALDLIQQGNDALKAGHCDKAASAFRKANKLRHDSCFECWMGIAQSERISRDRMGAWKSAGRALDAAKDDSQKAQAHDLRGLVKLADVQARADSTHVSEEASGMYLELKSNPPPLDKISKQEISEADQEYRTAVELDREDAGHHAGLARVLFFESRDEDAKREAQADLELAPDGQDSRWIRTALKDPRRARNYFAPAFVVTTLSGEVISLESLAGKFVVLDFWASWCVPCRESVDDLKSLTRKYPKNSVVLLSVSADQDAQEWRDYIARRKMDWAQYWDKDLKIGQLFRVREYPTYIVIDGDGVIRDRIRGSNPEESVVHRLKEALQELTPQKGS